MRATKISASRFPRSTGRCVNDGAKFSFNGLVGRRTLENGFYRAFEYNYGELVLGVGGGVCQASTTVYLAAMKAGMDLLEHTPHSQKVSYTDLGMDATVTDTIGAYKDMSFRNNSGGQIFIAAQVIKDPNNSKRLLVRGAHLRNGSGRYHLRSGCGNRQGAPAACRSGYVDDLDGEYVTFKDETKTITEASLGYVVDTYRITYENGVKHRPRKDHQQHLSAPSAMKIWIRRFEAVVSFSRGWPSSPTGCTDRRFCSADSIVSSRCGYRLGKLRRSSFISWRLVFPFAGQGLCSTGSSSFLCMWITSFSGI